MKNAIKFNLAETLADVSDLNAQEQIQYISLDVLDEDANNFYELSDLDGLADNIQLFGMLDPIRVRENPDAVGRYVIVSGHRRRAAAAQLRDGGDPRFQTVPCIVQRDNGSPELQELRLIFANSSTRKMSDAELSRQAQRTEELFYALSEQGMEFQGRMRDHVAKAVGASKSKLARLKVIRDHLDPVWQKSWESGVIAEATAYNLAREPAEIQQEIFRKNSKGSETCEMQAMYVDSIAGKLRKIVALRCADGSQCENYKRMMRQSSDVNDRYMSGCFRCCKECSRLCSCPAACKKCKDLIAEKKEVAREAERKATERFLERKRPDMELLEGIFRFIGERRADLGIAPDDFLRRIGARWDPAGVEDLAAHERGEKLDKCMSLPFGYCSPETVRILRRAADLLECSIDALLGHETPAAPAPIGTGWHTGHPDKPCMALAAIQMKNVNHLIYQRLRWDGEDWVLLSMSIDPEDTPVVAWIEEPEASNG